MWFSARTTLGAILVGAHDTAGELVYLGLVGSGFTEAGLLRLHDQLAELVVTHCPFVGSVPREDAADAVWVRPVVVGEVAYREITAAGRRLRHPVWRGARPDLSADGVTLP